ncbi:MAG: tRNA epoxyqueuosine(34) reductase QueG, partial [Bacteroidia bacterium]
MLVNPSQLTLAIKRKALELGFASVGISKAVFLEEEASSLESWLKNNSHGKMQYMENHFDKRLDPRLLVDGARSVLSLLFNYYSVKKTPEENDYKISKYAYGEDYHFVIKDKLKELMEFMKETAGEINGRAFVDSAPVLERAWAKRSGLGWVGKNTNLINQHSGSFYFLCEIISDLDLEYDSPVTDHCGTCTACIDACPTDAITEPYMVDGSKCISYFTIELKEKIPEEMNGKFNSWIFGCDICQDVCPWNRFAGPHSEPRFEPYPEILNFNNKDWEELPESDFKRIFGKSAIKRTGYNG